MLAWLVYLPTSFDGQVSCEFANFLASEVLTSIKMWNSMLFGGTAPEFQQLVRDHTAEFVEKLQPGAAMDGAAPLITEVCWSRGRDPGSSSGRSMQR